MDKESVDTSISPYTEKALPTRLTTDCVEKEKISNEKQYKLYKSRFLVVAVLALSLFTNGEFWLSLAAVSEHVKNYFFITQAQVDWFGNVFLVVYAIEAIPFSFMPQLIGIKLTLLGGVLCNLIGTILRFTSFNIQPPTKTDSPMLSTPFMLCMAGNVFAAFGQGFLLNLPALVSARWYSDNGRIMSTSFAQMTAILGSAMGFIFSPLLLNNQNTSAQMQGRFIILSSIEFGVCMFTFCISLFVKEKPDTPPSHSEEQFLNTRKNITDIKMEMKQYFKDVSALFHDYKVWIVFIIYGLYYSLSSAFYIFLSGLGTSSGINITSSEIGFVGFGAIISGTIMGLALGIILERYLVNGYHQKFGSILMFACSFSLLLIVLLMWTNKLNKVGLILICVFYGSMAAPYLAIGYEVISNHTYPVAANISIAVSLIVANILGSTIIYGTGYIPENKIYIVFLSLASALYFISSIITAFLPLENKRVQ